MTPTLHLRPWMPEDAPVLNAAVLASLEHLRPWMPWASAPPMSTQDRLLWFAVRAAAGDRLFGAWRDGTLVGTVGLHARIAPDGREIGYWVCAGHLRQGVATEMARQAVAIAFRDPSVTHVEIRHDIANHASGRVAARLGFTEAGEEEREAQAPAETGVVRIWRLERDAPVSGS